MNLRVSDDDDDDAEMVQADCLVVVCRARFTRWFMVSCSLEKIAIYAGLLLQ